MDSKTNTIRLDFRDNPDLKTLLGGMQPGDRTTLEIELMTKSVSDESFEANVESITASTSEDAETEETDEEVETEESDSDAVKPTAKEPVMIVMMSKSKKKKYAEEEIV